MINMVTEEIMTNAEDIENFERVLDVMKIGTRRLAEIKASEAEKSMAAERISQHRTERYHNILRNSIPEVLRPYANLKEIVWSFDSEPANSQQERFRIEIPGFIDMEVYTRINDRPLYVIPQIVHTMDEDGQEYVELDYSWQVATQTDDSELALAYLCEAQEEIKGTM